MKPIKYDNTSRILEVLSFTEVEKLLIKERIIPERAEIISTFLINLSLLITKTYLGTEYLKNENDYYGHFKWCFNNVNNKFLEQDINFYNNSEIFEYLYQFYLLSLYQNESYQEDYVINYWYNILDVSGKKYKIDFDTYVDIYSIFNIIFQKKINK